MLQTKTITRNTVLQKKTVTHLICANFVRLMYRAIIARGFRENFAPINYSLVRIVRIAFYPVRANVPRLVCLKTLSAASQILPRVPILDAISKLTPPPVPNLDAMSSISSIVDTSSRSESFLDAKSSISSSRFLFARFH